MRFVYLDIDTTRADHLGCYGYHRNTSPNLDRLAEEGVRFDKCYVSDAPCLPSRASMFTGRFGIHTGVVNHGGQCADIRPQGRDRGFNNRGGDYTGFIASLRNQGFYPVSFSTFAERHASYWFYEGWHEMYNEGSGGGEDAKDVIPWALDWLDSNWERDNFFLHINIWDPHTDYIVSEEYGDPFADEPLEGWYTEEMRQEQWDSFGPGTPQEPCGAYGNHKTNRFQKAKIDSMDAYKRWVDGYDTGIHYADWWLGKVLDKLEEKGILDDTVIMMTSDHGENMGELGVIGDHATADHITSRVPMIIRWPGMPGRRVDDALHNQCDIAATIIELAGGNVPAKWDGQSFADAFKAGRSEGREKVVSSQCCWSCQRSVRWDDWIFIRTYHTGLKNWPKYMLFNIAEDPHELNNLAEQRPELVDKGRKLLAEWHDEMMAASDYVDDPMRTVLKEGGPFHTRDRVDDYCSRLRETGRSEHAAFLQAHPTGLTQ